MVCAGGVWVALDFALPTCSVGDILRRGTSGWECCHLSDHATQINWAAGAALQFPSLAGFATSSSGLIRAATYPGEQIYVSADNGATWTMHASALNWGSIAMSSDGTIMASVVDGGQIYVSTDGGNNWTARATSQNWNGIAISDDGSHIAASVSGGRIYVSTNGGNTWSASATLRAWSGVAMSANGMFIVATVTGGQIYISTDGGATWTASASIGNWETPQMSADGTIVLVTDTVAAQSYLSKDGGTSWAALDLPAPIVGLDITLLGKEGNRIASLGADSLGNYKIIFSADRPSCRSPFPPGASRAQVSSCRSGRGRNQPMRVPP